MLKSATLPNGLVLIVDEMPYVSSVAYDVLIPGGIVQDEEKTLGASLMLSELTARGAGDYNSQELLERFDDLGITHSESTGKVTFSYKGKLLADKLPEALELVSAMILKPHFPEDEFESVRNIFIQDIRSLEDDPARKAMVLLTNRYFPKPYNRTTLGTIEGLNATDRGVITALWERLYRPKGSIISIAGNITFAEAEKLVLKYFSNWEGQAVEKPKFDTLSHPKYEHIESDSAQLQITLAYPSVTFDAPLYYPAKVTLGVLSGGMFGRLFVEVREKLGLCYTVYASHSSSMENGTVTAYAGTMPERADKTLEVMLREMRNVEGTVTEEELERAKANYLAGCIIGEESTVGRASANSCDWWYIQRVRSLEEIKEKINSVSLSDVDEFCRQYPLRDYMILTLGPRRLDQVIGE